LNLTAFTPARNRQVWPRVNFRLRINQLAFEALLKSAGQLKRISDNAYRNATHSFSLTAAVLNIILPSNGNCALTCVVFRRSTTALLMP
jgi:hypothetical protein